MSGSIILQCKGLFVFLRNKLYITNLAGLCLYRFWLPYITVCSHDRVANEQTCKIYMENYEPYKRTKQRIIATLLNI